ncbi:TolC family protein [Escherichia coli]|uniref:TolC family protein n=1 Tax=Escherichia coli TaxID=562 RepID=UPI00191B1260|nr:TolC family protein [Escherichia coli]
MKLRIAFSGMFYMCSLNVNASACIFDNKYINTDEYRDYHIQSEMNTQSKEDNLLGLLPSIYINSGQSASNNNGFKGPEFNSASISLSQSVYSGGYFIKNNERIENDQQLIHIKMKEARIKFILDAFTAVQQLKSTNTLINTYSKYLEYYKVESKRADYLYKQGELSELELKLRTNNIKKYERISASLKTDVINLERELKNKYFIPPQEINSINLEEVKKCKTDSFASIAKQASIVENKKALNNYEMEKTSYYPSLSLSFSLMPKNGGTLRDINIKEGAYGVSMNLSIPVSGIFKLSSLAERHRITMSQVSLNKDKTHNELNSKRMELEYKLKTEENNLEEYVSELHTSREKLDYLRSRVYDNKIDIMNYINEVNNIYSIENKISDAKNKIEIYKAYFFYID